MYKDFQSYNTVRNDANSILKFRDFNPINRGTIDSMDKYVSTKVKDLQRVNKDIDSELEEEIDDDCGCIERPEKLTINKKTPFQISTNHSYPYGFQNSPFMVR